MAKKSWKKLSKSFSGFSLSEYLFRMSSRKLGVVLTFAAVGIYLNHLNRLSQSLSDLLVGLALAYCASNILQKKMQGK